MNNPKEQNMANDSSNSIQATSLLDYANQYMANMKISNPANNSSFNSFLNIKPPSNNNLLGQNSAFKLENLMPKLNLNSSSNAISSVKNEEMKENIPDNAACDDEIDLSIAIIKKPLQIREIHVKQETEEFVLPPVPDDDIPIVPIALKKTTVLPCLLYNSGLRQGLTQQKPYKVCSTMGKVLSKQFRKRRVPYIDLKYHEKIVGVKVFKFDVPSPDEKILEKLLRKK